MDFGDVILGFFAVMIGFAVIFTWCFALFDLMVRDMSGIGKVLWLFGIILFPLFGVLMYFILRPGSAGTMVAPAAYASAGGAGVYNATQANMVGQVDMLRQMKDQGTITDEEFTRMKQKVGA